MRTDQNILRGARMRLFYGRQKQSAADLLYAKIYEGSEQISIIILILIRKAPLGCFFYLDFYFVPVKHVIFLLIILYF